MPTSSDDCSSLLVSLSPTLPTCYPISQRFFWIMNWIRTSLSQNLPNSLKWERERERMNQSITGPTSGFLGNECLYLTTLLFNYSPYGGLRCFHWSFRSTTHFLLEGSYHRDLPSATCDICDTITMKSSISTTSNLSSYFPTCLTSPLFHIVSPPHFLASNILPVSMIGMSWPSNI